MLHASFVQIENCIPALFRTMIHVTCPRPQLETPKGWIQQPYIFKHGVPYGVAPIPNCSSLVNLVTLDEASPFWGELWTTHDHISEALPVPSTEWFLSAQLRYANNMALSKDLRITSSVRKSSTM